MAEPLRNNLTIIERVVGNREPITAQLLRNDDTTLDLTSAEYVKFRLVKLADGSAKVDNAAATKDEAATGKVSYTPAAIDVDTAGEYAIYWLVKYPDSQEARIPYDGARFILNLKAETDSK